MIVSYFIYYFQFNGDGCVALGDECIGAVVVFGRLVGRVYCLLSPAQGVVAACGASTYFCVDVSIVWGHCAVSYATTVNNIFLVIVDVFVVDVSRCQANYAGTGTRWDAQYTNFWRLRDGDVCNFGLYLVLARATFLVFLGGYQVV